MRRIDIGNRSAPKQLTAIMVGDSRSGKTHAAATFPRPFFLMDASEHGWTTLEYMDTQHWYEPDRAPVAYAIDDAADMMSALVGIQKQARGEKVDLKDWPLPAGEHEIGTVVIDSLTFYADAYVAFLQSKAASVGNGRIDQRQVYGDLHAHLRYFMIQVHKLPYNVIWTALPKDGGEAGQTGGLMVAGQIATKAPARCDLWVYMSKSEVKQGGQVYEQFDMHTQNYGGFKAGHRFGSLLPPVMDPTYRALEESLGLAPWTDRLGKTQPKGRKATTSTNRAAAQQ